jgi:hypothetical protein
MSRFSNIYLAMGHSQGDGAQLQQQQQQQQQELW